MKSSEIRKKFLKFFEKRGHRIVLGSSLVPDDPTLLLTGAGMVQFKPIFEGEKKANFTRAASCQRCVRTTDIENVGYTARHLTFFEMLGNFSFGDYYKKEAICWGWEFLTKDLKLDPDKLWITIFKDDSEAFDIWHKDVGIAEDRIVRLGKEDNFWQAGPVGPCGPCTEMVYDLGTDAGCGRKTCDIHCGCDRFLEVWNLVFMQYNRKDDGELKPLAKKGVDTGLGLERAASILQGVPNNFETDLLHPIVSKVARLASIKYGENEEKDTSLKIVSDHIRAITFLINDGVLPSNEGRGYVLRRLLRRAVRHGRLLEIKKTFLPTLIEEVVEVMKEAYPEVEENKGFIESITRSEEERFTQTLRSGLSILDSVIEEVRARGEAVIGGEVAFQLYDTYGFPLELTQEIAKENSLEVDVELFERLMEEQKEKARASWGEEREVTTGGAYKKVYDYVGDTTFVGYEQDEAEASIKAIVKKQIVVPQASKGDRIEIVLDVTPLYAEKGGQVGDKGEIRTTSGTVIVEDTQVPISDMYVHKGKVTSGSIKLKQEAEVEVDTERRTAICRNHTATHLLHWALRLVLGKHVKQAGSLVEDKRFRFDFTHFEAVSKSTLKKVEKLVNEKIFQGHSVRCYTTSFDFAKESGVIALFGEKYGNFVRVVEIGNFSRELCGGTHVSNTNQIGLFRIVSEGSIGANLRRIEGLTSSRALDYTYQQEEVLAEVARMLKAERSQTVNKLKYLLTDFKERQHELESLRSQLFKDKTEKILSKASTAIGNVKVVVSEVDVADMDSLRSFADIAKSKVKKGVLVLGATSNDKAMLVATATKDLVKKGFNAGKLLGEVAPIVGGGGGGRGDMAQAGGRNPEKLSQALKKAQEYIKDYFTR